MKRKKKTIINKKVMYAIYIYEQVGKILATSYGYLQHIENIDEN